MKREIREMMDAARQRLMLGELPPPAMKVPNIRQSHTGAATGKLSEECLLGYAHYLGCPKLDCNCMCHKLDGEVQ